MARFDNKVVLVSGGARGQGAAEARLLVAQGAKVVIGDVLDNQARRWLSSSGRLPPLSGTMWPRKPIGPAPSKPPRSSAACTAWSTMPESTSRPR